MAAIKKSILDTMHSTPLVELSPKINHSSARLLAKVEFFNPGGSIKDRVALKMVEDAESAGRLKPGDTIIEPTSGNTGVGLALVSAVKGYHLILVMPDTMSMERRLLAAAYGAEIVLTPGKDGMKGSIAKAEQLREEKNGIILQQFENPSNPLAHFESTGPEIWADTDGKIDAVVSAVGTGGTLTGIARYLKEKNPGIKIVAVEPMDSPVLSGGNPAPHKLQGIGAGFIPKTLDVSLIDEVVCVKAEDAFRSARLLATHAGILTGISSGAALYGAMEIAERAEYKGKTIVVILPDTGERYLSTELYNA